MAEGRVRGRAVTPSRRRYHGPMVRFSVSLVAVLIETFVFTAAVLARDLGIFILGPHLVMTAIYDAPVIALFALIACAIDFAVHRTRDRGIFVALTAVILVLSLFGRPV